MERMFSINCPYQSTSKPKGNCDFSFLGWMVQVAIKYQSTSKPKGTPPVIASHSVAQERDPPE